MQITLAEFAFIQQYRLLREENKIRFNRRVSNPLLISRFRRFIGHKPDDSFNIATPKRL